MASQPLHYQSIKKMNSGQFYTFDQLKNNFFGFLKKELCCIEVSIESFFIAKPISKTILEASNHYNIM